LDLFQINWLTALWSMVAASLLTLAAMNLALAVRGDRKEAKGHLLFVVLAVSAAATGVFELLLANAETIDQYGALLKWAHVPVGLLIFVIPWFVLMLFRAGRPSLAILGNALWGAALAVNFFSLHSRVYGRITSLERLSTLGGSEFTWVAGTPHPARWLGYAGVTMTLVFVVDAAIDLFRRGEIRRASIVGVCLGTSLSFGLVHSGLVDMGLLRSPHLISVAFVFIMGGMAFELVHDAVKAPLLERRVQIQQAEVAHLSRNTMLGEISGGIAHELSQPLNAILNNAQSATSFLDREPPDLEEVRAALLEIAEQDRHMSDVVGSFAQLMGKEPRTSELVDLNGVVEEVLELARKELERSSITVSTDLAAENSHIRGDRVLLSVIVFNLVRNSIDAMSEIERSERWLSVVTEVGDRSVELVVSDSGPGIPEENRDRVFEAFFTTRSDGSGLGLAVSHTLAELHGGEMRATLGLHDRGTSMHVFLPTSDG